MRIDSETERKRIPDAACARYSDGSRDRLKRFVWKFIGRRLGREHLYGRRFDNAARRERDLPGGSRVARAVFTTVVFLMLRTQWLLGFVPAEDRLERTH